MIQNMRKVKIEVSKRGLLESGAIVNLNPTRFINALSLVALFLAGCGTLDVTVEEATSATTPITRSTGQVEESQGVSPPASVTPARQDAATPIQEPAPGILPAPIYYISGEDGQIWRVDADGVTTTQITSEEEPVTEFDVSPRDGALVYLSGNRLIYLTVALGGRREVLLPGPEDFDGDDYLSVATRGIDSPSWSPDGSWIVFGEGGINLYQDPAAPRQEGVPEIWTAFYSDPLPDPLPAEGEVFEGPQAWYTPVMWSPDGEKVLVRGAYYFALGRIWGVVDIKEGALVEIDEPRGLPCCHLAWGQSSDELLYAGNMPGTSQTGLWRLNPDTGESTVLVPAESGREAHLFAFPFETTDGRVQGFYATEPASPNPAPIPLRPMIMVVVAGDGWATLTELRDEYYVVGDADWLADGSGAVIVDIAGERSLPAAGPLRWLPADGRQMVALPASGRMPQWGIAR